VQQANQLGMVFARLDCAPRWRERLGQLTLPTLVVHGRADPFFPVGNGEALADAIPAARLLVLDDMGTALRNAAAGEVTAAMLALADAQLRVASLAVTLPCLGRLPTVLRATARWQFAGTGRGRW
jgi:pimeloyl-ACP methyl ester carboxylesterase